MSDTPQSNERLAAPNSDRGLTQDQHRPETLLRDGDKTLATDKTNSELSGATESNSAAQPSDAKPSQQVTQTAICAACSATLDATAKFCIHCGASQNAEFESLRATSLAPPPIPTHPTAPPATATYYVPTHCTTCNDGQSFPTSRVYCSECRRLKPLAADYRLGPADFLWELDAAAMQRLSSIEPVNAMARKISDSVGRPWFEASLNGIRLGEDQLPDIFALAVKAARIVGLPYMPEIYVSGEQMWDAITMGSEGGAFIAIGSVLANMRGKELLYVLAREMGHVRAGHALWRTVVELATGRQSRATVMGEGLLTFLNPAKLIEGAVQAPLLAWKRHSEITADRAALLAVGDDDVAAKTLTQMTLRSFPLYDRLNQDALRRQEAESEDATLRFSEATMSVNPYLTRRLRHLREFHASEAFQAWRKVIAYHLDGEADLIAQPDSPKREKGAQDKNVMRPNNAPSDRQRVKLRCAACGNHLIVPRSALEGTETVNIRCPQPQCRKVMSVRPKQAPKPGLESLTE